MKNELKNELLLYPCPVVLVTSKYNGIENVLAVSWIGIASSHPEYLSISVKTTRLSHDMILSSGVFTVNIPDNDLLKKVDYCGTYSGRNTRKIDDCGFTCTKGYRIDVPMIEDCPVNIECVVHHTINLGSHTLVVGRVVGKYINDNIDQNDIHAALSPLVYIRPNYYNVDKEYLGKYGKMNERK